MQRRTRRLFYALLGLTLIFVFRNQLLGVPSLIPFTAPQSDQDLQVLKTPGSPDPLDSPDSPERPHTPGSAQTQATPIPQISPNPSNPPSPRLDAPQSAQSHAAQLPQTSQSPADPATHPNPAKPPNPPNPESQSPLIPPTPQDCPKYAKYAATPHGPFSGGKYNLSYQRPDIHCRSVVIQEVEDTIARINTTIKDPDLSRVFTNSFPNTLDTTVKWHGFAANDSTEELTFIITGDIPAMWLRDSANQLQSYLPLLSNNTTTSPGASSLSSLYRGALNLQARYILTAPFCNAFQPPPESGLPPPTDSAAKNDVVTPPYSNETVYECKYELDSLAAFLQLSTDYHTATGDKTFFAKYNWVAAVELILATADSMRVPTYDTDNGTAIKPPYTFQRASKNSHNTLPNSGAGSPVAAGTGLVRSAFRPSDDSTVFQFLIPANMMFAHYLNTTSAIVDAIGETELGGKMRAFAADITEGIAEYGTTRITPPSSDSKGKAEEETIYAYEVDGYGGKHVMDDANVPSLLAAPLFGYNNTVCQATRKAALSAERNPYFMRGAVAGGVGGPHNGPGWAWPMAGIVRILTSDDDAEIVEQLGELVGSTRGLGLIHESVHTSDEARYTRSWFAWANGLFGQMVLDLAQRKPDVLGRSFQ